MTEAPSPSRERAGVRVKFATPRHCKDLPLILSVEGSSRACRTTWQSRPLPHPKILPILSIDVKRQAPSPSMGEGWGEGEIRHTQKSIHPAYPVHPKCWIRLPSPTGRGAGGEGRTPDDSPPLSLRGAQPLMVSLSNHVAIPSKQRRRFLLSSQHLIIWYNPQRYQRLGRNRPSCVTALTMRTPAAP